MTRNLDIGLVRAFVAVVDAGGMTAAGARLNLTQAAISQQLKRLEDTLGAVLVTRERKAMRLTSAGVSAALEQAAAQAKRSNRRCAICTRTRLRPSSCFCV